MLNDTYLKFIHICEMAFFSNDNKLNIIGVFEKISTAGYPFINPRLSIVTGIDAPKGEYTETIKIFKRGEENNPVIVVSGRISIVESPAGANFVANFFGVLFKEKGDYIVKVFVNEEELKQEKETIIRLL